MAFPMSLLTELCFPKRLVGYIHAGPFGPLDQPGPRCFRTRKTKWVRLVEKPAREVPEDLCKGQGKPDALQALRTIRFMSVWKAQFT
jgi:hypothetical protein